MSYHSQYVGHITINNESMDENVLIVIEKDFKNIWEEYCIHSSVMNSETYMINFDAIDQVEDIDPALSHFFSIWGKYIVDVNIHRDGDACDDMSHYKLNDDGKLVSSYARTVFDNYNVL